MFNFKNIRKSSSAVMKAWFDYKQNVPTTFKKSTVDFVAGYNMALDGMKNRTEIELEIYHLRNSLRNKEYDEDTAVLILQRLHGLEWALNLPSRTTIEGAYCDC